MRFSPGCCCDSAPLLVQWYRAGDTYLSAYNPNDGNETWTIKTGDHLAVSPDVQANSVTGTGNSIMSFYSQNLCVNKQTKEIISYNGKIYDYDGNLLRRLKNPNTGNYLQWYAMSRSVDDSGFIYSCADSTENGLGVILRHTPDGKTIDAKYTVPSTIPYVPPLFLFSGSQYAMQDMVLQPNGNLAVGCRITARGTGDLGATYYVRELSYNKIDYHASAIQITSYESAPGLYDIDVGTYAGVYEVTSAGAICNLHTSNPMITYVILTPPLNGSLIMDYTSGNITSGYGDGFVNIPDGSCVKLSKFGATWYAGPPDPVTIDKVVAVRQGIGQANRNTHAPSVIVASGGNMYFACYNLNQHISDFIDPHKTLLGAIDIRGTNLGILNEIQITDLMSPSTGFSGTFPGPLKLGTGGNFYTLTTVTSPRETPNMVYCNSAGGYIWKKLYRASSQAASMCTDPRTGDLFVVCRDFVVADDGHTELSTGQIRLERWKESDGSAVWTKEIGVVGDQYGAMCCATV